MVVAEEVCVGIRWWLWLALAMVPAVSVARDDAELRACLQTLLPSRTLSFDVHLVQTGVSGETELRGRWYWRREAGGQSGVLKLTEPQGLAGAAYLIRSSSTAESELYMYLPAVGKVRRVNGATVSQSLYGSGLSAFDLKLLLSGLRGGRLDRIDGPVSESGRRVERWKYQPPLDPDQLYDRVDFSVDVENCMPTRAALYGGVPWKTVTVEAERLRPDGRRVVERATLTDLRQNTRTRIEILDPRFDENLPAERFRPDRFYR